MVHHRNLVMLVAVTFILIAFIPSAQAEPPAKPGNPGLPGCLAKAAELEAKVAELEAQIVALNASLKYKLPKTGQTFVQEGYPWGQDGEIQAGIAWPDPRFTDNGDGTVTDNLTDLVWLKDAATFQPSYWYDALYQCYMMGDGWRLPNRNELLSLIDIEFGPIGKIHALPLGHPFINIWEAHYWTSSTANTGATAWSVFPVSGDLFQDQKGIASNGVWCVRDPQ